MRKLVLLLAFIVVLLPSSATAQAPDGDEGEGALIRINSDAVVAADETIENLVVIKADAIIEGTVTGTLLVIDGDATISGTVGDTVTVISGDIILNDTAVVHNVHSIRGDITRAPGATVTGDVDESDFKGIWATIGVLSVLLWIGITIATLAAGVLFAIVGGRQLTAAATLMTGEAANAIVGTIFFWIGVPILAVLAIITVIGLPLGLGILIFVMPIFGFLGYLVAATRVGTFLTGAMKRPDTGRPVLSVLIGVLVLQVIVFIPLIGVVIVFLASIWGAGALAYVVYRSAGGKDVAPAGTPPPATA